MKYKITQILHNNTTEVDNFNNAVFTDEFDKVAEEIVKLFAIPVVGESVCQHPFEKVKKINDKVYHCSVCDKFI